MSLGGDYFELRMGWGVGELWEFGYKCMYTDLTKNYLRMAQISLQHDFT